MIKWHANVDISSGNLHNLASQLVDYTKSKIDQVLQIVLKSHKVSVKVDKNYFVRKRQYHFFCFLYNFRLETRLDILDQ